MCLRFKDRTKLQFIFTEMFKLMSCCLVVMPSRCTEPDQDDATSKPDNRPSRPPDPVVTYK